MTSDPEKNLPASVRQRLLNLSKERKEPIDLVLVRNGIERLENARIPLQVDIGFGDIVTPAPEEIDFPALLDFPAPHLRAYPIYTVVAEKLEASVRLGEANTRMKDFFDLWFLSRKFSFDGELLKEAVTRTFARREMARPATVPVALTPEFAALKAATWAAFTRRNALATVEMTTALAVIRGFAWPVLDAAAKAVALNQHWRPTKGWEPRENKAT